MLRADVSAELLLKAVEGDPWYGASTVTLLRGLSAAQASFRPARDVHSIWELVLHMTAWAGEVDRRLGGRQPQLPVEGDWPEVGDGGEEAWRRTVDEFVRTNERLGARIREVAGVRWDRPVGAVRDAAMGTGVTHAEMLLGVLQHNAYHTGQIALVRKLVHALQANDS